MKNRIIETVALIFGLLTTVAGVLTLPQVALLPESLQPYVGLALALVVVGKNASYVILDFSDDGKLNKSWRHGAGLLLVSGLLLGLTSCATQPDGAKTFIGLDRREWLGVGQAAVKAAVPAFLERRRSAQPLPLYIEDWTATK